MPKEMVLRNDANGCRVARTLRAGIPNNPHFCVSEVVRSLLVDVSVREDCSRPSLVPPGTSLLSFARPPHKHARVSVRVGLYACVVGACAEVHVADPGGELKCIVLVCMCLCGGMTVLVRAHDCVCGQRR